MVEERGSDRPESEEPPETAPGSQGRSGLMRGPANTLCPEGWQRTRREWVWRTWPPKRAKGMRKPLQEIEHSAGQASEELGELG